jgi:hypothetical protein
MHDLIDDIDIDISFFLSPHILVMLSEFEDESCSLYLAIHGLVALIEESEKYIGFFYLELVLEIDTEPSKVHLPARCSCTEVEILSIDEGDIFGFHMFVILNF